MRIICAFDEKNGLNKSALLCKYFSKLNIISQIQEAAAMVDIAFRSAKSLAGLIRRRKIGCVELLDHYLTRVERHNPALNAIIVTDIPRARRRARAADRATNRRRIRK